MIAAMPAARTETDRRRAIAQMLASWRIEDFEPDDAYLELLERYATGALTLAALGAQVDIAFGVIAADGKTRPRPPRPGAPVCDDDPYTLRGADVLRNKPGFLDGQRLQDYEFRRAGVRGLELDARPLRGKLDLAHMNAIHGHLFRDCYDWAGRPRTIGISKGGSLFAMPQMIESCGRQVFGALAKEDHLKGLDLAGFAARMAHHFTEINALHPYREGNGRTARVFLEQLAAAAGWRLDYRRVTPAEWIAMSRDGFDGRLEPGVAVFERIASASGS